MRQIAKQVVCFALILASGCGRRHHRRDEPVAPSTPSLDGEHGELPVQAAVLNAFNNPVERLQPDELRLHEKGDRLSEVKFVTAPAPVYGGLGPLYNNNSCANCHHGEGRGRPVLAPGRGQSQLIIKVSLAKDGLAEEPGGAVPVPGIGVQIQDQAIFGVTPPATATLAWREETVKLADDTSVNLRSPQLDITVATGAALDGAAQTSLRLPPPVYGLGLLEAISEDDLKQSESDSQNGIRVPGRLNYVWSRTQKKTLVGRFGRKANKALIRDQVGVALALDIGLENSLLPGAKGEVEVQDDTLDALTFYIQTLAAPAARTAGNKAAEHGQAVFRAIGCNGCHVETMHTGSHAIEALTNHEIHPYSDLLLHDMGPGLADHRADFLASGSEWRTPPLWGIGLQDSVLPDACYLHDGRARSLTEAIMWHGGQAALQKQRFRSLNAADRGDLLAFLRSL